MRLTRGLFLLASLAAAQNVVQLPSQLAAPGATLDSVFNRDPRAGQNNRLLGLCEGPAADSAGNLYFSELGSASQIWKITPQGTGTVFFSPGNSTNGLGFDNGGRLYSAQNGLLMRFHPGGARDTLIRNGGGLALGSLNDLSVASTGHVIVTNNSGNKIFLLSPGGALLDSITVPGSPNGVEWIEETGTVYLNLANDSRVVRFQWFPEGNTVSFRQAVQARVNFIASTGAATRPDGITMDSLGNLYVATNAIGTVKIYSPQGDSLGRITVRGGSLDVSNCAFGGPGNKTLYITGNGGVYKVQMKVPGRVRPAAAVSLRPGSARKDAAGSPLLSFDPGRGSLRIQLPEPAAGWEVGIYDARQRKAWGLSNPRAREVTWDGTGRDGHALPAGRYFIGLYRDGKTIASRKVLLLRN